jgi:PPM family protein phosphatase
MARNPFTLEVSAASHTDAGGRERNEDDLRIGSGPRARFAVLSDGAGGHRDGGVAADIVVRVVTLMLQQALSPSAAALANAIEQANACLVATQEDLPPQQRMHATVVALWIDVTSGHTFWAHAGDSRLYLVRRGAVRQLTRDDSLVQQLVDAGLLSADDARHHPKRNQLLVAMGSSEVDPARCVASDVLMAEDGDAFLLCTDGWWGALDADDIDVALARAGSVEAWLADMAATVAARAGQGQDNYTAIGVWVGDPRVVTRFG